MRFTLNRGLIAVAVLFSLCMHAAADDLHVPAAFATIQDAVDAAKPGDHVIIAPGVYSGPGNNTINPLGKAITIRSTDPSDFDIVSATILSGEGADVRAFDITSGEGPDTVIAGLTIMSMGTFDSPTVGVGTAVRVRLGSFPTIEDCFILGCTNTAIFSTINSGLTLRRCIITGNTSAPNQFAAPGGVFVTYNGVATIEECDINCNIGGGVFADAGAHLTITDTRITDNFGLWGGGLRVEGSMEIHVDRCQILRNFAEERGGGMFFSPYFELTESTIRNSIFADNHAGTLGGGVFIAGTLDSTAQLHGCTIANNTAGESGGGLGTIADTVTLAHSILWNNNAETGDNLFIGIGGNGLIQVPGTVEINHAVLSNRANSVAQESNTQLNLGASVMSVDPLFVAAGAGDYHLSPSSPLIDAGDRNFSPEPGELDIDGEPRVQGERIDIGADEVDHSLLTCAGDTVSSATFEPPGDGTIDGADLAFLLGEWGPTPSSPADIVSSDTFQPPPDGVVDGADLAFVLGAWGDCSGD